MAVVFGDFVVDYLFIVIIIYCYNNKRRKGNKGLNTYHNIIMFEFPSKLIPSNISKFSEFLRKRNLCKLRGYVYETILEQQTERERVANIKHRDEKGKVINKDEKGSIACNKDVKTEYNINIEVHSRKLHQTDIMHLVEELKTLGWNVTLGFGNTMLYIGVSNNKTETVLE